MSGAAVATETILDLAADLNRLAHLACGIEMQRPDEPTHALCGHPLLGVDAPPEAPHCPECDQRMHSGGGGFASLLGALRCDQHPIDTRHRDG
jgi:hypothetical protein